MIQSHVREKKYVVWKINYIMWNCCNCSKGNQQITPPKTLSTWGCIHQPFSRMFFVFFLPDFVTLNLTKLLIGCMVWPFTTQSQLSTNPETGGFWENAGTCNQYFLLYTKYFLPFPKQISNFESHIFCCLQFLWFWTSLEFCRLVELNNQKLFYFQLLLNVEQS